MDDDTGHVSFSCNKCGFPVSIDKANPPNDNDIISCLGEGCGHQFGTYAEVKEAMIAAGKAEIDKLVTDRFGKPPTWTKG
jgi:hypothetical protein